MKLYFRQGSLPWQPERYHYAAEQMMLTLFPGERPEYPGEQPDIHAEDSCVIFTLSPRTETALLSAHLGRQGKRETGHWELPLTALQDTPERVYHVVQHALKMAFYQAGTALLGFEPPWGALTGVRPVKLPTRCLLAGGTAEQARRELEEEYRVSPARARLALRCAQASVAVGKTLEPRQVSVYVGIPFCPTRCAYCSFVSADVGRTLKLVEPYLQGMRAELEGAARAMAEAGLTVRSFYMGGGTPTTLTAGQMDQLLTWCRELLPLEGCTEYTVEAGRPDTITREKLQVLKDHGVERISINPQTLEGEVLSAIGRRHTPGDILQAYALAREVGFGCVNMDLIAGLPRDSYEGFARSLEGVLALSPENITVHTLALKKGSSLMEKGGALPTGEEVGRMLALSQSRLEEKGYAPYYLYRQKYMSGALENVGWARPGTESVYNIVMMEELQSVISIGAGGVTKLVGPGGRLVRLSNPKYPQDYLAGLDRVVSQKEEIPPFYALP